MLTRFRAWIRSRRWEEQVFWWLVYGWLWLMCQIFLGIKWIVQEITGYTAHQLRRLFRWLLPVIVVVAGVALAYTALGSRGFSAIFQLVVVLMAMAFGLWLAASGFRKPKKKRGGH